MPATPRQTPAPSNTTGTIADVAYSEAVNARVMALWDAATCWLTDVVGTNEIAATCTPTLTEYKAGMSFLIIPTTTNTGAVQIDIDEMPLVDVVQADSLPLTGGMLAAGVLYKLTYDGSKLRLQGGGGGSGGVSGAGAPVIYASRFTEWTEFGVSNATTNWPYTVYALSVDDVREGDEFLVMASGEFRNDAPYNVEFAQVLTAHPTTAGAVHPVATRGDMDTDSIKPAGSFPHGGGLDSSGVYGWGIAPAGGLHYGVTARAERWRAPADYARVWFEFRIRLRSSAATGGHLFIHMDFATNSPSPPYSVGVLDGVPMGALKVLHWKNPSPLRHMSFDASGTLAGRAAYDANTSGFRYIVNDVTPNELYERATATAGVWIGPVAVLPGIAGAPCIDYTIDTSATDSTGLGSGVLRFNSATQNAATVLYCDDLDRFGVNIANYLNTFDDAVNAVKGVLSIKTPSFPNKLLQYSVTGTLTGAGYRAVPVSIISSSADNPFTNGERVVIGFARSGDGTSTGLRERLTAARTYYVKLAASGGSDSNDGLALASAFATIQKAVDTVAALDLAGFDVTISVAAGTYTGAVTLKDPVGYGQCIIVGDYTTPANVLVNVTSANAFDAGNSRKWTLRGMVLQTVTSGNCVNAMGSSVMTLDKVNFGNADGGFYHIVSIGNSLIQISTAYSVAGTFGAHLYATDNAAIIVAPVVVSLGTSTIGNAWARAERLGSIKLTGVTYSGAATGVRHYAAMVGVIETAGATLPGTIAGSTLTGSQVG